MRGEGRGTERDLFWVACLAWDIGSSFALLFYRPVRVGAISQGRGSRRASLTPSHLKPWGKPGCGWMLLLRWVDLIILICRPGSFDIRLQERGGVTNRFARALQFPSPSCCFARISHHLMSIQGCGVVYHGNHRHPGQDYA
ncbi:hypothetical protein F4776DRAFT_186146 [Hypoxylon sp. NC0597]|nr:hypothetical protein F4776DRAFT_186146 [Hypoxylon sp. NC0597]